MECGIQELKTNQTLFLNMSEYNQTQAGDNILEWAVAWAMVWMQGWGVPTTWSPWTPDLPRLQVLCVEPCER